METPSDKVLRHSDNAKLMIYIRGFINMSNILEVIEKRSSTRGYQPEKLTGAELDC